MEVETASTLTTLNDARRSNADNVELRKVENAKLRAKLNSSRSQVNQEVNDMMAQMMSMTGDDFDMAEIDAHLNEAFQRFDEDHSGESGEWEFTQAWPFLGLKGSQGGKAFL